MNRKWLGVTYTVSARPICAGSSRPTPATTTISERICSWIGIRQVIGQSNGSASSLLCRFSADFIINIAGRSSRQGQVPAAAAARIDKSLVKALAWARDLRWRLERGKSLAELASEDRCSRPYVSSLIRLAYLAPDITRRAVVNGTQPAQLTLARIRT
jgi:hypothetical protein